MAPSVAISDELREQIKADSTIVTGYIHPHSLNVGVPTAKILPPKVGGEFPLDENTKAGTILGVNVQIAICLYN